MPGLDFARLNAQADMLALVGGGLKRVAATGGGEWAGPCPFCGGRDRFRLQPNHSPAPRWLCRSCTAGSWRTPLDFIVARDRLGLRQAAAILNHQSPITNPPIPNPQSRITNPPIPNPQSPIPNHESPHPPNPLPAIERAIRALWCSQAGETALRWLAGRGLSETTLRYFLIGWSTGQPAGPLYLPRGVALPCLEGDRVWYIKIALLPGQPVRCSACGAPAVARQPCPKCAALNKYRGVKGNRGGAMFNAAELDFGHHRPTLFVEGEFDCLIAWQALRDRVAVVTLGSAGGQLDVAYWGARLLHAGKIFTLYDNDPAGEAGRRQVSKLCAGASREIYLPPGVKDINDFLLQGGDLSQVLALAGMAL